MQCKACLPPGCELAALASPFLESAAAAREAGGAAPLARTASAEGDHPALAPAGPSAANASEGAPGQVGMLGNCMDSHACSKLLFLCMYRQCACAVSQALAC